jgi:hypothetical protein
MKPMKKLITILAFVTICSAVQAQEIGARFGDVLGNNVAVDALFSAGKYSRIHADVSFGSGVGVEVLYDFLYKPLGGEAFYWYAGVGASMLIDDPFWLGASGELGLSYKFNNVPISLSADWRPTFYIIEDTDFHAGGFGVNIRYVLGGKK